ncbi:hypothetical protein LWI28_011431 [Acer negundo]|uniref:Plastocyanin-like domain-containing protein n=1 Tax=Acer negundo TaxID=4023 RepID=A0AAD5P545_ACENE|nr:hypothetical protein LWI28_011431 [Acer negundo]
MTCRNMSGFYTEDFPDNPPEFYDFVSDQLLVNTTQSLMATKVKVLEYGEEVEIVFQLLNVLNGSEDHLMHLHGYSFYTVDASWKWGVAMALSFGEALQLGNEHRPDSEKWANSTILAYLLSSPS